MIKLSEKGRKILRAVYRGLGTAAVSLTFGACNWLMVPAMYGVPPGGEYGMPPYYGEEIYLRGIVKSKKTGNPITNISVWIEDVTNYYTITTWTDGSFDIYLPKMDNYTLIFTDIDGERNGLYKRFTIRLTREEVAALSESPLIIALEEEDESSENDEG